jgi:uncharacterized protein (TIGR03083 family)
LNAKGEKMAVINSFPLSLDMMSIPYVTADEAAVLIHTELERFLALVETLIPEDWSKPTACTAWSVRDILAHQAGGYASGTSYREMIHQYSHLPKSGQLPEDATNEIQLSKRSGKSPAELIAELKSVGPIAAQKWAYQFRLVKPITIPHRTAGSLNLRHLMWVIHSRDTWMHRLDICRATGRKFEQTAEHDGRIAALVMLDGAKALTKKLDGRAIAFALTGVGGGNWKVGIGEPSATIRMDVLDFNIFVSGRFSYEHARTLACITGDIALSEIALKNLLILF